MTKSLKVLMLGVTLLVPMALTAADRDDKRVIIEDRSHHDTHEWNNDEDGRYRTYLQEHHKKYREYKKLNRKDQDNYWEWRHQH